MKLICIETLFHSVITKNGIKKIACLENKRNKVIESRLKAVIFAKAPSEIFEMEEIKPMIICCKGHVETMSNTVTKLFYCTH